MGVKRFFPLKALHLTEKLKLPLLKLHKTPLSLTSYELVIKYGENSYVFIYNYGSIVFFNISTEKQEVILKTIKDTLASTNKQETEDFIVELKDYNKVLFNKAVVSDLSLEKIKIISTLLAESVALEYYEAVIEKLLGDINIFSKELKKKGQLFSNSNNFTRFIGTCLDIKQEVISNLYIVDSPDEIWENIELDRLHKDLKMMLEISVRYRALEYKIKIIQESIEILIDLARAKREIILEMTVIFLIALEIVLSIWH